MKIRVYFENGTEPFIHERVTMAITQKVQVDVRTETPPRWH